MEISKLNENVTDRRALEKQEGLLIHQGTMSKGRHVRLQPTAIPAPHPEAVASQTSRQAIITHAVTAKDTSDATMTTAITRESEAPETTIQPEPEPEPKLSKVFATLIDGTVRVLSQSMQQDLSESSALSFCLEAATKIHNISRRKEVSNDHYKRTIQNKIGPFYAKTLNPALKIMNEQIATGYSWEFPEKFFLLARCLEFYPANMDKTNDEKIMAEVCLQLVSRELCYLDHMKDSFFQYSCDRSFHTIDTLLSNDSPVCCLKILEDNIVAELKKKAETHREHRKHLLQMEGEFAGKKQEEINIVTRKIRQEPGDMMTQRTYYDVLNERIDHITQEWKKDRGNTSNHQLANFLEELAEYCEKDRKFLEKFTKLYNSMHTLSIRLTRHVLIMIKDGPGNVDQLKNKSMNLIGYLGANNWLNDECRFLYTCCLQPKATARTGEITDLQCQQQLGEIASLVDRKTRKTSMEAARKLQQFLNKHGHDMKSLCTALSLGAWKNELIKTLHVQLFMNFLTEWDSCRTGKVLYKDLDDRMSHYYSDFVDLTPYAQLLMKRATRHRWETMACAVWSNRITAMLDKTSFGENDVDILLKLNDITWSVPNTCVKFRLKRILEQLFQFVLNANNAGISVDKLTRLSEWAEYLTKFHLDPDWDKLRALTEEWQQKQCAPAPTHPGFHVANRLAEVLDGPHHTEQPSAVPYCSMTQSPAANRPNPMSIPQPMPPAFHDTSTPADHWSYQQPAAVPYCSHCSTTQSPAANGPNPMLIPQPMPAMVHHFPVYARTQTWPSRQLPVCGPVQSQ